MEKSSTYVVSESCSVISHSLQPRGLYSPWNSPGQNTGVGSLSLLQRIFLTQELNWGLLHCRWILYQLSHQGSPYMWLSKSLTLSELLIISFLSPIVLIVDISQVSLQLSPVTSSVIIVLQRSWWEDHELSVVLISKSQI